MEPRAWITIKIWLVTAAAVSRLRPRRQRVNASEPMQTGRKRATLTQIRVRKAHEQQQEGREDQQDHSGKHIRLGARLATAVILREVIRLASARTPSPFRPHTYYVYTVYEARPFSLFHIHNITVLFLLYKCDIHIKVEYSY